MKILIINRQYDGGGGAEAAVRGLAEMLVEQKHKLIVLTQKSPPPFLRKEGVHVRYVRSSCNEIFSSRIIRYLADLIDLITPIKVFITITQVRPDVVHTHNLRGLGMLTPAAIRFARRWMNPLRWYHTLHDIQLMVPSGVKLYRPEGMHLTFLEKAYAAWNTLVWGSPDAVIAPSQFLLDFYKTRGFFAKSDFRRVPNVLPSPAEGTHCPGSSPDQSGYYGINNTPLQGEKRKTILFVGVLEESKGIKLLIDAYLELRKPPPGPLRIKEGIPLEIVGDGSLSRLLQSKYASDYVIFHGEKTPAELAAYYQRALVTVVPSLTYENAPTVIQESFHWGVPVIASRIGGIHEYVRDGIHGYLAEPGNFQRITAILQHVSTEGVSDDMKRNCRRQAVEIGVQAVAGHRQLYGGLDTE